MTARCRSAAAAAVPRTSVAGQGRHDHNHTPSGFGCPVASQPGLRETQGCQVLREGSAKALLSPAQPPTWINRDNHFVFPEGIKADLLRQ